MKIRNNDDYNKYLESDKTFLLSLYKETVFELGAITLSFNTITYSSISKFNFRLKRILKKENNMVSDIMLHARTITEEEITRQLLDESREILMDIRDKAIFRFRNENKKCKDTYNI